MWAAHLFQLSCHHQISTLFGVGLFGRFFTTLHYTTHTARPRVDLKPSSNKAISSLNLSSNCSGPMDDDRLPEQLCTQKHFLKFTSHSPVHDMWLKGTDRKSWATICVLISKLGWNWVFLGETFLIGHCTGTLMEVKLWEWIIHVNIKLCDTSSRKINTKKGLVSCAFFSANALPSSALMWNTWNVCSKPSWSSADSGNYCFVCFVTFTFHSYDMPIKAKINCSLVSKSWAVSLSVAR